MISKLPRWVESGAFILALIAGFINSIGLLGFQHQAISHLSGTATQFGTGLITASFSSSLHLLLILISFVIGSIISGYYLKGGSLKLGRRYSGLLYLEAVLLLAAIFYLSDQGGLTGHYFASAACGLQNALATTYSGAVVRTTHMTGIFTDIGIMVGAKLRGEAFDKRKLLLFLLIITGFISGGALGAYFFEVFYFQALFIPVVICTLLAFSYSMYSMKMNR
ncbi:DUF1275 domain-containing protein [Psychromonas sp. B3M02]|uniref:YoaK family protein n=1 Tax=Psychromonas sp. B3M02 TaxID=2267226 RepID=UPI000DEAE19A|nr:YoaK family protein [Psychromonas sp. B3M02]RBW46070.1 DUF1275 domain-containing protein [Psychromonas sp. B3M02]